MERHESEEIVRRGYDAIARGDLDTVGQMLSDDVAWHVPGNNPMSGEYRGKQQVMELVARAVTAVGGDQEVHDVVGNERHVVGMVKRTLRRPDGGTLESRAVQVFHVEEDGKISSLWTYNEDQPAVDEFFSQQG